VEGVSSVPVLRVELCWGREMGQVSHYKSLSNILSRPRGGLHGKVVCI